MKNKMKSGSYKNLLIGIACGAAAVLAVGAVLVGKLIYRKKRRAEEALSEDLDEFDEYVMPEEDR